MRALPAEGQKILDNKFKGDRMGGQADSPIEGPQKGHPPKRPVDGKTLSSRLSTLFLRMHIFHPAAILSL